MGGVLPFMEQGPMFNAINFTISYDNPANTTVSAQSVSILPLPQRGPPGGVDAQLRHWPG